MIKAAQVGGGVTVISIIYRRRREQMRLRGDLWTPPLVLLWGVCGRVVMDLPVPHPFRPPPPYKHRKRPDASSSSSEGRFSSVQVPFAQLLVTTTTSSIRTSSDCGHMHSAAPPTPDGMFHRSMKFISHVHLGKRAQRKHMETVRPIQIKGRKMIRETSWSLTF